MKQLILLKQSSSIQIAHLYEHLFCSQLDTFLRDQSLFQGLDYYVTGNTYYGGVINVQTDLYTDQAVALVDDISKLSIEVNVENFLTAANQILAEKQEPIGATGYDNVLKELQQIQAQPWQTIDTLKQIDAKSTRRRAGAFYIADGKPIVSKKLYVKLILDQELTTQRKLLPLFQQMSRFIMHNVVSDLADIYGYYSVDDTFKVSKESAILSNLFRVGEAEVNLKDISTDILELVNAMKNESTFERFAHQLTQTSYFEGQIILPDIERIYEDTLIFIGAEGWKEIATIENCNLLLKHISVEVRLGKDYSVAPLVNI